VPVVKEKLSFGLRVVSFQKVLIHAKTPILGSRQQVKTSESSVPEVRLKVSSPLNCPTIEPQPARAPKVKRNRLGDKERRVSYLRFHSDQQAITKSELSSQGGCEQSLCIKEMR
jgi:hypothetical protein